MTSLKEFLLGLIHLMRPAEWSKSFGNMAIASTIAWETLGYNKQLWLVEKLILGSAIVCLLWSGLYTLNDYSDRKEDAKHKLKKFRPIPSGKVPAKFALIFGLFLVFSMLYLGFTLSKMLGFCMAIMVVNQFLYTFEPFKLKKRKFLDLISGSLVNPTFRFLSGWVLFAGIDKLPLLAIVFILSIQFGGYGLYRYMSKDFEKKQSYRSSVATIGPSIKKIFYIAILIGVLAYFGLFANYFIKLKNLGSLKPKYIASALVTLPFVPLYISVIKNPEKIDSREKYRKIYKAVYLNAALFFTSFPVIYFL